MERFGLAAADGRPLSWYDIQFADTQLTEQDMDWLSALRRDEIDDEWIEQANSVVAIGSISLQQDTDPETISSVMGARRKFFGELLGWANEDHELSDTYDNFEDSHFRLMPLSTVINTQRTLHDNGINVFKCVKNNQSILGYASVTIEQKIKYIDSLGFAPEKLVNSYPAILTYSPSRLERKMACIDSLGLDPFKLISGMPSVLSRSKGALRQKMNEFRLRGLDPIKIFNRLPSTITKSTESIQERVTLLENAGVSDAGQAINGNPAILTQSTDYIYVKLKNLSDLGLDTAKVVGSFPQILSRKPEAIERRINNLYRVAQTLGWEGDIVQLINYLPAVLAYSDDKLRVHGRFLAAFGEKGMPIKDVASHIVDPLEGHFIALNQGVENYSHAGIARVIYRIGTPERKEHVKGLIEDPKFAKKVGQKTILAYRRYAKM